MTEMDSLRLRVAARAYRATRPSDDEVERGVRRTLSAMRRSQIRRRPTLTPAIIVAILAFGTLAYANPNNVRRWMTALLGYTRDSVTQSVAEAARQARVVRPTPEVAAESSAPVVAEATAVAPAGAPAALGSAAAASAPSARTKSKAPATRTRATWAEVNSALAGKDTPRALSALGDLSRHGDASTRANAQLGIAQLLWSRGDRGTACSIAKTLLQQKGSPSRVQERARAMVSSCTP
jgi:hypothetical protein